MLNSITCSMWIMIGLCMLVLWWWWWWGGEGGEGGEGGGRGAYWEVMCSKNAEYFG